MDVCREEGEFMVVTTGWGGRQGGSGMVVGRKKGKSKHSKEVREREEEEGRCWT